VPPGWVGAVLAVAREAIMAEWDRTDLGFADRRSDLVNGTNVPGLPPDNVLNGQLILLKPATDPSNSNGTAHANSAPDTLMGNTTGHNWFFYDGDDTLLNDTNG
jgi:hypothetical protein